MKIGDSASLSKTVTETDIVLFAGLSLDTNPVHLDEVHASKTQFGGRIAHGMLAAGLVSAVLGTKLPGPGTIYLSQTLKFKTPVRPGDTITATATVATLREDKPIATLETVVTNQDDVIVLTGEAAVFCPT